ncbi:hypothetical protein VULLAG_LOCUS10382 [Vulpes lagopus]
MNDIDTQLSTFTLITKPKKCCI